MNLNILKEDVDYPTRGRCISIIHMKKEVGRGRGEVLGESDTFKGMPES